MRFCSLVATALLFVSFGFGADSGNRKAIEYAKRVDVSKLDPSLPSQSLETWLRSPKLRLEEVLWSFSADCSLKEEPSKPVCVRFTFKRGRVAGWGMVAIGTQASQISGSPHLLYITILPAKDFGTDPTLPPGRIIESLSELESSLDKFTNEMKRHQGTKH